MYATILVSGLLLMVQLFMYETDDEETIMKCEELSITNSKVFNVNMIQKSSVVV